MTYTNRPPVTAHKQFERKEKHTLMVVPTMGSHGREGLAPSEPDGNASGWVSARPAMCVVGHPCR